MLAASLLGAEQPSLRQKQRAQQQARVMATELVSNVLDIQLRQLKENNLEKLPIYSDIEAMRGNLEQLVDNEMQEVVDLLVKAQQVSESERQPVFLEARGKVRSVVVSLMAQRQKLYKRMQLAKIAAQTRQLISLETKVLDRTKTLSEQEPQERERSTLTSLEDQRDVAALYFQLVDTLMDVSTWEGPIGAGASKGQRLLKTLQVDQEFKKADESLSASRFSDAESAQLNVIKALKSLLEVIEETQGLVGTDHAALMKMVAALIKKQEDLRGETKQADLREPKQTEEFAQRQHEIHQDLGRLAEALQPRVNTEALAEQAKAAAYEAEAKLFEGDQSQALQQQGQVIGALAEIEKKLRQTAEDSADKTAEQLAQEVQRLEKLNQDLDTVRAEQDQASAQAPQNAPGAKAIEDQVAQHLAQANQMDDFGSAIETRMADAQDAVTKAQQKFQDASPQMADQRTEAAQDATQAMDRAAAEVKQALADLRREQFAVEVGELARAAEALERAAAAEREVSQTAMFAAQLKGLSAESSKALAAEQGRINEVAQNIAAGVKGTAPHVAQQLAQAQPTLDKAAQQLQNAIQQPGEASKPAASEAASAARQGAQHLEQAAAALRKEAGDVAARLAQLAGQQLQPIVAARRAVSDALSEVNASESPAEPLANLQNALRITRQAQTEQVRAAGRSVMADAQASAQQIDQASQQQSTADQAANDFARGKTNSPLSASTAEQRVAEMTADLAKQSPKLIARELENAARAAAQAAKEMVIGNPNKANAARRAAREALDRAGQVAQQAATESSKQPAGPPNAKAQRRVSQLAQEARQAVGDQVVPASAALATAKTQSESAEKALAADQTQSAATAQGRTADALAQSAQQLQDAINELAKKQSQQAQQQVQTAAKLVDYALPVDAGAAVALQQAEQTARESLAAHEQTGEPSADAKHDVQRGFERAEASLTAREQELRRDQSIAEAIAQLAIEQQAARDQIAKQAAMLEQLAKERARSATRLREGQPPVVPPPGANEQAAAQALAQSSDQFADAQRATGEGAAEISGQEQVANRPIRIGLQKASELGIMPPQTAPQLAEASLPSSPPSTNQAENSNPPLNEAAGTPSSPSKSGQSPSTNASPQSPAADRANDLGTGFVPNSPEVTAQQIAGRQALQEAARALAQRQAPFPQDPAGKPANADISRSESSADAKSQQRELSRFSSTAKKGGAAVQADKGTENEQTQDLPLDQTGPSQQRDSRSSEPSSAADIASRKYEAEPWFAKLPPALQKAIQAKARRGAPRGYEERLKRYFESID